MALRGSHLAALAIAAGIAGWMWQGDYMQGGTGSTAPIAEREAARDAEAFRVRVATVEPTERFDTLMIRGRTEAESRVEVKAETNGTLRERYVDKGDIVQAGDRLCTIDPGVRESNVAQAEAALAQAQADYDANAQLLERGYTTRSRVRALKTALDGAKAALDAARQEIGRTDIVAPVGGRVQDPIAEIGDVLRPGDTCLALVDFDPMLFVGQVGERDVAKLKQDMTVRVELVGDRTVEGRLRFIAPTADADTRTFRIEATLPNDGGGLLEGVTAQAFVPLAPTLAFKLQSSWLTLSDEGEVGVRTVNDASEVGFVPVRILAQTGDGLWVEGLEPGARVIALGQNFVSTGERVVAVPVDPDTDRLAATPAALPVTPASAPAGTSAGTSAATSAPTSAEEALR